MPKDNNKQMPYLFTRSKKSLIKYNWFGAVCDVVCLECVVIQWFEWGVGGEWLQRKNRVKTK